MIDYVQNMLDGLPENMSGEAATPAANFLFETSDDSPKLDEATADLYHHNTAKLLFLCKRARPDVPNGSSLPLYPSTDARTRTTTRS
jgi:hypothetical protein